MQTGWLKKALENMRREPESQCYVSAADYERHWTKPVLRLVRASAPNSSRVGNSVDREGSERGNTSAPNVDELGHCFYCGRENPDAVKTDYCSAICRIAAMGEGA